MNPKWQDKVRKIRPYVPGEQSHAPDLIKLNANENPYPPSPATAQVLRSFSVDQLRKYPDTEAGELRAALSEKYGVPQNQIFMGNGSDDVLALCFQTFFCSDLPIVFPDITYSFYPVWCSLFRIPYRTIPLDDAFRIQTDDYRTPCGGIILPNPNAPTGIGEPLSFVETLLKQNEDCIVIIDEAYIDFGGESALPLLQKYDNLVIVQTMSKSRSLAGLRIGYAFASAELIAALDAVKNSYNSYTMDMLSIAAGAAAVRDDAYFRSTCEKVMRTRDRSADALRALGFSVLPSQTNFLMASHSTRSALDIFTALKERNIFIRYFNLPRIDQYLRITIGTDAEMDALFAALRDIL